MSAQGCLCHNLAKETLSENTPLRYKHTMQISISLNMSASITTVLCLANTVWSHSPSTRNKTGKIQGLQGKLWPQENFSCTILLLFGSVFKILINPCNQVVHIKKKKKS